MTDMTLEEAVATVARFAKMFEAVQALAGAIDNVSKLDQLTQEAEQRRVDRQKQVDEAEKALAMTNDAVEQATKELKAKKVSIQAATEKARFDADTILNDAKQRAAAVVAEAADRAAQMISSAQETREKYLAEANEAAKAVNSAEAEVADKQKELAVINGQIERARSLLKGFMGEQA